MEERTQIKFSNPDIDGSPRPQLVTLEQETPVEGRSKREDGTEFVWHKWLCTGDQYFMASPSLDGMLKMIPNKLGKVIKIEKVPNPKGVGAHPFFQINGKNKDEIITDLNVANLQTNPPEMEATMPQTLPSQPDVTSGALARLEKKLDQVIGILDKAQKDDTITKDEMPF